MVVGSPERERHPPTTSDRSNSARVQLTNAFG